MKSLIIILFVTVSLAGCATSTFTTGRDFSSEQVKNIIKGKTTSAKMIQMFGEPFNKSVSSENEERWFYLYTSTTAHAQSFVFSTKVNTVGKQKNLQVLIKDGVVANYTFTDNPLGGTGMVTSP